MPAFAKEKRGTIDDIYVLSDGWIISQTSCILPPLGV